MDAIDKYMEFLSENGIMGGSMYCFVSTMQFQPSYKYYHGEENCPFSEEGRNAGFYWQVEKVLAGQMKHGGGFFDRWIADNDNYFPDFKKYLEDYNVTVEKLSLANIGQAFYMDSIADKWIGGIDIEEYALKLIEPDELPKIQSRSPLRRANEIAVSAHEGVLDKNGVPYICHPITVMYGSENETEAIVSIQYDVVEDSNWTINELAG